MKTLKAVWSVVCLLTLLLSLSGNVMAQSSEQPLVHPVILIHGMKDQAEKWDSGHIYNKLTENYDAFYVTTFAFVPNQRNNALEDDIINDTLLDSFQDIEKDAEYLKSEVDFLFEKTGAKVDIIAHSLGGLVTREYLRQNPSDHKICRFIDIGTPHAGSSFVDLLDLLPLPSALKPSTLNAFSNITEQFGYEYPDQNTRAFRQLLPGNPFLERLNSGTSDGNILYSMFYGDIEFQFDTKLFWYPISSIALSAGDLVVSSKNAATIPNLGELGGTNPPNYKTIRFKSPTLKFLANILPINILWEVKIDGSLDGFRPYWHSGLLSNPKVLEEILSTLNKDYVPRCRKSPPPTVTPSPTLTPTATSTPTPTSTPTRTVTSTPELISSLEGTVIERSQCRYGPSQYHLFKTGFRPEAPVKIIGRDADGDWLQIELGGVDPPCWINASLVQVEGDVMALPDAYPPDRRLQWSADFPQIGLISASPGANGVTASWIHHEIPDHLQQTDNVEYIIEVWTCVDGKPAFYAVGTDDTVISFQVDNSCGIASYAHLIGQDEHGFSFPTKIPLP